MQDIHAEIAAQIIEQLEQVQDEPHRALPWHRPFVVVIGGGLPQNALTKREYRGSNCLSLWIIAFKRGYLSDRWATYKQWQALGGQVLRGSRAVKISVPMIFKDGDGDDDENKRVRFSVRSVFEDQVEIEYPASASVIEREDPITPHEVADQLVKDTGAIIKTEGQRAFYRPSADTITMPARHLFTGTKTMSATEGWYATLLHELVHWSGHESRLGREGIVDIGRSKEVYARAALDARASLILAEARRFTPLRS